MSRTNERKKTPGQMVDDLLRIGPHDWIPPIPRYRGLDDGEEPLSWSSEYRVLEMHHTQETILLYAVIREMARRLGATGIPCPECGSPMVYETRPDTIEYGGQSREIQMLAWWCTRCGEGIFEGKPLAERDHVFLELKAEVDEVQAKAMRQPHPEEAIADAVDLDTWRRWLLIALDERLGQVEAIELEREWQEA